MKSEFFAPVLLFHLFEILHQNWFEVASCMYQWGGEALTEFVGCESMKDVAFFCFESHLNLFARLDVRQGRDCVCWRLCMNVWERVHGMVISVPCC